MMTTPEVHVKLDVAIRAQQLKPFRVGFDLTNRCLTMPTPQMFLGGVFVVEVEGIFTFFIAAPPAFIAKRPS
jgi:hypothetical protein